MKRNYKIICLLIFIYLLFPKVVFAGSVSNVTASGCNTNVSNISVLKDLKITDNTDSNCKDDTSNQGDGGLYSCVSKELNLKQSYTVYIPAGQTGTRSVGYIYITGRIDVWSHSNGSWNNNTAFGKQTCPNMKLSYNTTETLNSYVQNDLKNYKNVKVTGISIGSYSGQAATYGVKESNYSVKMVGDGPQLTDDSGTLINNTVTYNISISALVAKSDNGLGYNGINKTKCIPDSKGNCTNGLVRALHYFTPVKIEVELDTPDPPAPPDPCKETVDGKSPKQYASENPGKCCNIYPETCCNDINFIVNLKKSSVLEFCCKDIDGPVNYNGFVNIKTFKGYHPTNYFQTFYNESNSICPTNKCNTYSDYYTYEFDGVVYQSECCKNGMYKDQDYIKEKCALPDEIPPAESCLSNEDYFNNNLSYCCEKYPDNTKCVVRPEYTPPESYDGLSCSSTPGTGIVASGVKNESNGATEEFITFTSYRGLADMEAPIKAGTGFDYDVDVQHTVTKYAEREYDYYSAGLNYYSAVARAKDKIDNYLQLKSTEKTNVESVAKNKKIRLESGFDTGVYILDGSPSWVTESISETVAVRYRDTCWDSTIEDYVGCDKTTVFSYPTQKKYIYTYKLKLRDQFIAKDDASFAIRYEHKTEYDSDNIKTVNTTTPSNYLNGFNKIYTALTTTTGTYPFQIKLNNESGMGATGNLENNEDGFQCLVNVVNQYYMSGTFTCGVYNDSPCPDDKKNGRGFYFRQISLSDPFPNRISGSNWSNNATKNYITDTAKEVYTKEPMYEIKLTPALIKEIKEYNNDKNYNYSWVDMEYGTYDKLDLTSKFVTKYINNGVITVRSGLDRTKRIGDFE